MSSQSESKLEDIPLRSLYDLLRPITVPAKHTRFNNWGRAFFCTPLAIFEPESEYQCKLILELARREGKTVRAVGVGHSPSDLACTSGYMVRLTKMNRLIQVSIPSTATFFKKTTGLLCHGPPGSFGLISLCVFQ
jgi:L-gulonolactone oxidase